MNTHTHMGDDTVTNGTITIAFHDIANDVTIEHGTRQLTRTMVEREIRYIVDHMHPQWVFVNYEFGDTHGTMFPWRIRTSD